MNFYPAPLFRHPQRLNRSLFQSLPVSPALVHSHAGAHQQHLSPMMTHQGFGTLALDRTVTETDCTPSNLWSALVDIVDQNRINSNVSAPVSRTTSGSSLYSATSGTGSSLPSTHYSDEGLGSIRSVTPSLDVYVPNRAPPPTPNTLYRASFGYHQQRQSTSSLSSLESRHEKYHDIGALSPNSARLNAIYNQIMASNANDNVVAQQERQTALNRQNQQSFGFGPATGNRSRRGSGLLTTPWRPRSQAPPATRSASRAPNQMPPFSNRNYQEARYKTELCLHFRERNSCPHGSRCLFAHGLAELRPYRGRHPKHKTAPCKSFHDSGYCNYGYRCSYIHMESPRTIGYIKSLNAVAQESRRNQKRNLVNDQRRSLFPTYPN